MGRIEIEVQRRARKQNVQRAVLTTVGAAGFLLWAMAAPNTLRLLQYTPLGKRKGKYHVNKTINRLIERGEIRKENANGKMVLSLTPKGNLRYAQLSLGTGQKHTRWDKRWRIVIFDIPEKYRRSRDLLREALITTGFHKLQESVWVYPHDCEDLVALMKTQFSKGYQVLYIVSEHVENDQQLRKLFNLPLK